MEIWMSMASYETRSFLKKLMVYNEQNSPLPNNSIWERDCLRAHDGLNVRRVLPLRL